MLIGTAIRIARSLGLHQESNTSKWSLFQIEMKRRLWWHLRVLDFVASMDLNCFESSDSFLDCDTIFPLNISDSELDPTQDITPLEHQGASEMSFSILRFDVCARILTSLNQYRFGNIIASPESIEQLIQDLSLHLNKQYLQLFDRDLATPSSRLCSAICQQMPTRIRILLDRLEKPLYSATVPFPSFSEIQGNLLISSVRLLDFHIGFPDDEDYEGWTWIFGLSKHWRAVEFVLLQLDNRLRDLDDVSKSQYWDPSGNYRILLAWQAVEKAFERMSPGNERHDIWRKLKNKSEDIENKLLMANLLS
jgi:hypothetical protein